MSEQDRLKISGQRYRQQREGGLAGWAIFMSEILTAGFEVHYHWIGDLDGRDKDAPPFYKGVMFVEAGKPKRCNGQPRPDSYRR